MSTIEDNKIEPVDVTSETLTIVQVIRYRDHLNERLRGPATNDLRSTIAWQLRQISNALDLSLPISVRNTSISLLCSEMNKSRSADHTASDAEVDGVVTDVAVLALARTYAEGTIGETVARRTCATALGLGSRDPREIRQARRWCACRILERDQEASIEKATGIPSSI